MILPSTPELEDHHTKMKDLLRHIMEAPYSGLLGIDLHLGQKPKLGGRYTDNPLIFISYLVGTLYIHVSVSFFSIVVLVLFLLSKTQKDQKYFCCFSLFVSLVSVIGLLYFLVSVYYSKTQKYLLFFFGFVKFAAEFNSLP